MPGEFVHYTITGAQDWPMFKEMLAGIRLLFLILWGTIGALVGFMWRDLRGRIASQRKEDKAGCAACKRERDGAFLEVWDAIDTVAPRNPLVAAAKKKLLNTGVT